MPMSVHVFALFLFWGADAEEVWDCTLSIFAVMLRPLHLPALHMCGCVRDALFDPKT